MRRPHPDINEDDLRSATLDTDFVSISRSVEALTSQAVCSVDVAELFNPSRFGARAKAFDLVKGTAFDLRTGWDLSQESQRALCWEQLEREQPHVVIGSPMCAPFSTLAGFNANKPGQQEQLQRGYAHLQFCMEVYLWQISRQAYFLHEHPFAAKSWKLRMVERVLAQPGVTRVVGDQCVFDQAVWESACSCWIAARKRTGWMTNMPTLASSLGVTCGNESLPPALRHQHSSLLGGRASSTEIYPPALVDTILEAIRRQLREDRGVHLNAVETDLLAGPHVDEDPMAVDTAAFVPDSSLTEGVYDEYTGTPLDKEEVLAARNIELAFFDQLGGCWEIETHATCLDQTGKPPIPTRWIDHDKNAGVAPLDLRSRWVVCETKARSSIAANDIVSVFSATPPLEIFRFLCCLAMSLPSFQGEMLVLIFLDISRAHPHCKALRDNIYVVPPAELGLAHGLCLRLLRSIYGLRDANQAFEFKVKETFEQLGFIQGRFSPCVYHHASRPVIFAVHGDDYVGVGPRVFLLQFETDLGKLLIVKNRGVMGPRPSDMKTIKLLARSVTWHDASNQRAEHISWEGDTRHVTVLCQQLGIQEDNKGRATPADKSRFSESPPLSGNELSPELTSLYKSCCMRVAFLSLDRPDIQFCSKELARAMSKPTVPALEHLKHLVRYLSSHRRLVWRYRRQALPRQIEVLCDSNWAGCTVTRKSTTSVMICFGAHLITTCAFTQSVISLSSGEAEFYALVKAACRGIGARALLADMGLEATVRLNSDSSASLGMASRRGAQGVRHIETQALWLQHAVASRKLLLAKKCGKQNASDIGTKVLDQATLVRLLEMVGLHFG